MTQKDKAQKSADEVAVIAEFIANTLTLNFPPSKLKVILNVPLKQLEDELETLKICVKALK